MRSPTVRAMDPISSRIGVDDGGEHRDSGSSGKTRVFAKGQKMVFRQFTKQAFYYLQRQIARACRPLEGSRLAKGIAIFALHEVAKARGDMAVSPQRFREQVEALLQDGYRCVSLPELQVILGQKAPLSQPSFALTFDDGYRSVYREALAILEEFELPATLFLTVGFLDGRVAPPWHSTDRALLEEYRAQSDRFRPLDWTEARKLAEHPLIHVGSHSMEHFMMGLLDDAALRREFLDSRALLEDRLGVPITAFAYPYGVRHYRAYSERTEEMLRSCGYQSSFTSEINRARVGTGPYLVPRISLVDTDTGRDAQAKAAGCYDWVRVAQSTYHWVFPNPHSRDAQSRNRSFLGLINK
jgi:peptidoglycan/xylan/chitin deacetylase (PgdA/CDA1 family)